MLAYKIPKIADPKHVTGAYLINYACLQVLVNKALTWHGKAAVLQQIMFEPKAIITHCFSKAIITYVS